MYINFDNINPYVFKLFKDKFKIELDSFRILFKITTTIEKKYDDFEKSIAPYLFINNIYYINCNESIYKIVSKHESSKKINSDNLVTAIKLKISNRDILDMYNNINPLFTIFKDDTPQSQVKVINLFDTPKEKSLKYAYINGKLLV